MVKKLIGMPPDADPSSRHGTYTSPAGNKFPPPNPARTLVMELLPKKFRNLAFVRSWAASFGPRPPPPARVDLDVRSGKALIEFATAEVARTAWESERLSGEGKEHIRVWWYRVPGIGADAGVGELEEGEIEDGELSKQAGGKKKNKSTAQQPQWVAEQQPQQWPVIPPMAIRVDTQWASTSRSASSSTMTSSVGPSPVEVQQSPRPPLHIPTSLPPKPVFTAGQTAVKTPTPPLPPPVAVQNLSTVPKVSQHAAESSENVTFSPNDTSVASQSRSAFAASTLQPTAAVFVPRNQIVSSAPSSTVIPTTQSPHTITPPTDIRYTANLLQPSDFAGTATGSQSPDAQSIVRDDDEDDVMSISSSREGSPSPPTAPSVASAIQRQSLSSAASVGEPRVSHSPPSDSASTSELSNIASNGSAPSVISSEVSRIMVDSVPSIVRNPTTPPSEPRATRNAPNMPSFAKRKELEERLAKRREEMSARSSVSTTSSGTGTPVSEIEAMLQDPSLSSVPTPTPTNASSPVELSAAMKEDDLRRLVLNSRKARLASTASNTPGTESPPPYVASVTVREVKASQTEMNLNDLAVSFITESIQAVTLPSPVNIPYMMDKPSKLMSPIFSEKILLAEKQKILERNIADQKELVGQYVAARTKADRDRLKAAMAERTRYVVHLLAVGHPRRLKVPRRVMEQEMDALMARAAAGREAARRFKFKWPETDKNACILVISDDEDDDDE